MAFSVTLTSGEDIFFSRHREREKENTQGTEGWSRLRDRMLAVKSRKICVKISFPSSYVKIGWEENFQSVKYIAVLNGFQKNLV